LIDNTFGLAIVANFYDSPAVQGVIFPTLMLIIALGILQAWRTDDISGLQKAEIKRDIVRELRREMHGITVVLVTHDPNIARHAQRVIEMADGKVVDDRAVEDRLFAKDRLAEVASGRP
jgi:hypothetical protein